LELNLKPRAESVIKIAKGNKRVQGLAYHRQLPVIDHGKLGLGGEVPIGSDVAANIFEPWLEEIPFAQFQFQLNDYYKF
jgi:hypothetical protein